MNDALRLSLSVLSFRKQSEGVVGQWDRDKIYVIGLL